MEGKFNLLDKKYRNVVSYFFMIVMLTFVWIQVNMLYIKLISSLIFIGLTFFSLGLLEKQDRLKEDDFR